MIIQVADEHELAFKSWAGFDSIFDLTCRPISPLGKRVVPDGKVNRLSYVISGEKTLLGRFSWFDYNPRNHSAEFGYIVNPLFRGQGHAKKMLMEAFSFIFASTSINKLYCQTAEYNLPSVKLLERIGMKLDGKLRQHHEKDGKLYDDMVFSILRSEWENLVQRK